MARGSEEYEEEEDSDFAAEPEEEEDEEPEGDGAAAEQQQQRARGKKKQAGDKAAPKKRKGAQFFDEEADEEDDDEGGGRAKRRKASRFIDDIAAVDSEEEEEEADDDVDDMLAHNDEDLGGEELGGGGGAAAHYRELDVLRQGGRAEQTEEELAKYLEDKYKEADYDEEDDFGGYGEEEDVGQQGLQPTKEDPGLFIVACRLGSEREACLQLLQKCYNMAERGTPLAIKSAACLDHLKGFLYVEAFRDSHVVEAVRGLRTIYGFKGARLVPLRERPAAVTVNRAAKAAIERDSWVRVRGGLYKDDLAKVVDVDYAGGRATVKLVPRLDLAAMAKDMSGGGKRNPFGRQAVRPPPKPFRAKEAGELGLPVGKDRNDPAIITLNTHRFLDGYTLRGVSLKGLILQDVAPPLDEVSRFNAAGAAGELEDVADPTSGLKQLLKALPDGGAARATYVKGDRVMVVAGELNTLEGTVEDVKLDEGKLLVRPDMMAGEVVELELDEVQKLFKPGDHVRVLSGPHEGARGMVVVVKEGVCVLVPDTRQGELQVFVKDLTEASDPGTGIESLGGKYELHDLVALDANTAGVIIAIDKDTARVLTNASTPAKQDVRLCRESDIMRKLLPSRASTTDANNAVVSAGDYVTLLEPPGPRAAGGARQSKGGTVHAISRGVVFLRCPELSDRGGFLVVRSRQVRLRGSGGPAAPAGGPGAGPGVLSSPKHVPGSGPQNPYAAGGAGGVGGGSYGGGGFGVGGSGGRGGGGGRGRGGGGLMGAEVTVRSGPYARYKGRVKQETATHLQLELDAVNKIVTVKKEHVLGLPGQAPGALGGAPGGGLGGFVPGARPPGGAYGFVPAAGPPRTPAHAMQTPLHPSMGGATPLHPGMTPMHPGMTPMHPGMTPAHPSMTPAHPSAEPDFYGGRGGRPPSAATPMGGYGGAATPMGGYAPAPTPGTAETPGAAGYAEHGNARTPGAAATPGGPDGYAYTPGGYGAAPTPRGGDLSAPSPGAGGYGEAYYAQPTPGGLGLGATPGTVATPGMVTGYTPLGVTPGMAYTPGLDRHHGGAGGGLPGTPGLPGGRGGAPPPRGPDYRDVLVKLPGGGVGVGGATLPGGALEAWPLGGGGAVVLEVVELVEVDKKDAVKVVSGDKVGLVGEVMTFDGGDAVLKDGDVVDRSMLGKLKPPG
ncbi:SPT5 [Scenedesmus sp. PABB004]|nr:SPT5 [Scenedesmus sp. PABB004]